MQPSACRRARDLRETPKTLTGEPFSQVSQRGKVRMGPNQPWAALARPPPWEEPPGAHTQEGEHAAPQVYLCSLPGKCPHRPGYGGHPLCFSLPANEVGLLHVKNLNIQGTWVAQSVKRLPLGQDRTPGAWDRAPHQAPCSAGGPASPSACCLRSLPLSLSNG